jgi:hypothetical protein
VNATAAIIGADRFGIKMKKLTVGGQASSLRNQNIVCSVRERPIFFLTGGGLFRTL